MPSTPIHVHSVGMVSAVGLKAATGSAAMRAGIQRIDDLPYLDDDRKPLRGSTVSVLPSDLPASKRRLSLLTYALHDALQRYGVGVLERIPIIVALPAGLQPEPHLVEHFAADLSATSGVRIDPRNVRLMTRGSLGGYLAIATARDLLAAGPVLVAATDSLVTARELLAHSKSRRLLTDANTDGFVPAEAAACLLLDRNPAGAVATVLGLGYGEEPGLPENDVPLRSEGLTQAARGALREADLDMNHMDFRLSDLTGEGYYFKEQALVVSRVLRQRKVDFPLWSCTTTLGYVGAAAGLCNLAWAIETAKRGAVPGRNAIAWAGGSGPGRAALVLRCGSPN